MGTYEEGSPIDATFFLILILAGLRVLTQRQVQLSSLVRANFWLFAFAAYCFLAIFWSDFPFVAFKRWIKTLGHPIMALVLLSHPRPIEAIRLVLKRCGVVMLTFSVLFIKYFPEYGRTFSASGNPENCGIHVNKNELGYCCLVFGLFFVWNLVLSGNIENKRERREERLISMGGLLIVAWLLSVALSATSLVTFTIGSAVLVGLGAQAVPKRSFGVFLFVLVLLIGLFELMIGLYEPTLQLLGKDRTLTDRTQVWSDAIGLVESPLLGAGFESFWLGSRLDVLWAKWWWRPNQAHNGYLETYLNLGVIGLGLMLMLLLSTFRKITATFENNFAFARYRMALLLVIILYNFTEATFKALHLIWFFFYIIALDYPLSTTLPRTPERIAAPEGDAQTPDSAKTHSLAG